MLRVVLLYFAGVGEETLFVCLFFVVVVVVMWDKCALQKMKDFCDQFCMDAAQGKGHMSRLCL